MGWDCGFDLYSNPFKINAKEFNNIANYIRWKNNKWNFKINEISGEAPYPTYEEFCKGDGFIEYCEPDQEKVEYYQNHLDEGLPFCNLQNWCSPGRYLDEFIVANLHEVDEFTYDGIDDEFIQKGLEWVDEELEKCRLIPVEVINGVKYNNDETITLIPIDSVEVLDDKNVIRRIDRNYDYLYAEMPGFDDSKRYALETFRNVLVILKYTDRENNGVYYYRSF